MSNDHSYTERSCWWDTNNGGGGSIIATETFRNARPDRGSQHIVEDKEFSVSIPNL